MPKRKANSTPFENLTLAEKLSDILHDEKLPEPLYEAIRDGLTDIFDQHCDQTEFLDYERSPHYINALLRNYKGPHSEVVH